MSFICNAITANSDTEPIERQPGVPLSSAARERQNHAFLRVRLLLSLYSKPTQASTNALVCSSAHLPTARWAEPQTTTAILMPDLPDTRCADWDRNRNLDKSNLTP